MKGPVSIVQCEGYWLNGARLYTPDDHIILNVLLRDAYMNNITASVESSWFVNFTVTIRRINGTEYITDIEVAVQQDSGYETVAFSNKMAGDFLLYVGENNLSIKGSPFSYRVDPGPISISNCEAVWLNKSRNVTAGQQVTVEVLLKDAYNNSVKEDINFTFYFSHGLDGDKFDNVSTTSTRVNGHQYVNFIVTLLGEYAFHILYDDVELNGSPLFFILRPDMALMVELL